LQVLSTNHNACQTILRIQALAASLQIGFAMSGKEPFMPGYFTHQAGETLQC
jgi:hypothetical protein